MPQGFSQWQNLMPIRRCSGFPRNSAASSRWIHFIFRNGCDGPCILTGSASHQMSVLSRLCRRVPPPHRDGRKPGSILKFFAFIPSCSGWDLPIPLNAGWTTGWSAACMAWRCKGPFSGKACSTGKPMPVKWHWYIWWHGLRRAALNCWTRSFRPPTFRNSEPGKFPGKTISSALSWHSRQKLSGCRSHPYPQRDHRCPGRYRRIPDLPAAHYHRGFH